MRRPLAISLVACILGALGASADEAGPFVSSLWLVHRYGTPDAVDTRNDPHVKAALSRALKDSVLTATEMEGFMDPATFNRLAGADGRLDASQTRRALARDVPASRERLLPAVRAHAELLTTSFDMIDDAHRQAGAKFAEWLVKNYQPGEPLHVTVVCTGNSRRSILGATMGNIAAAYYGMPEVKFHSGGTAPTAFNSRTVSALKAIGVAIEPVGKEAERGAPGTANPVYRVRWGDSDAMEAVEFSKRYSDPSNPQADFAALMVCSEADAACPFVRGASLRVSMPYQDPKIFDESPYQSAKYAERRDDIGRLMLSVFMQARNALAKSEAAAR